MGNKKNLEIKGSLSDIKNQINHEELLTHLEAISRIFGTKFFVVVFDKNNKQKPIDTKQESLF